VKDPWKLLTDTRSPHAGRRYCYSRARLGGLRFRLGRRTVWVPSDASASFSLTPIRTRRSEPSEGDSSACASQVRRPLHAGIAA